MHLFISLTPSMKRHPHDAVRWKSTLWMAGEERFEDKEQARRDSRCRLGKPNLIS